MLLWARFLYGEVFDVLTPTKLLEITNPNQPLLRRLAIEAPPARTITALWWQTFAESGAQAIGADIMLTRCGSVLSRCGQAGGAGGVLRKIRMKA